MKTLILSTFFYACESWTLTAEIKRRIQALEMGCYRRLLNISYKDHVTNEEVCNRIQDAVGVHDDLLTMIKKLYVQRTLTVCVYLLIAVVCYFVIINSNYRNHIYKITISK